ncbi:hypothetical protein LXA43DRAFT_989885 [Ganoderma leucocontextum]|nr:hypothetical protein LXA43DRAFT_989885 [Ganoderma leucocontextum]
MPLNHRGYGAYISYNGEEVEVHKAKVESDKVTMSGYFVSEAGMEFKVHWIDSKPPSHLSVEVRMDGRRMGVVSHVKGSSKTSNGGFRVAVDALAPYQFASLVTHDNDDLPSAYSEDLGTIEIKLRRARDFVSVPFTPKAPKPGGSVHERKTKGRGTGSHCVSLGDKKDVKARSTILKPLLIDDKPYVVFRFYYRPREFLESKGIIRGRSPSRSSSATVVGSAKSSSGYRKKRQRPPSEAPPSPRADSPAPRKRHMTVFEQDEDMSLPSRDVDDDRQTPLANEGEDDNKENVVEIRLSSRDNYAIPGESASCVKVKKDSAPCIKREGSPVPQRHPPKRVKREPSLPPATGREASRPIKTEPSPSPPIIPPPPTRCMPSPSPVVKAEPLSPSVRRAPPHVNREPSQGDVLALAPRTSEEHVKREPHDPEEETWDEEEETLVEIHVSSRNQHLVFGRPPAKAGSDGVKKVKKEPRE